METPTKLSPGSRLVEAVCVDPKNIQKVWPHVKHLIAKALHRGGNTTDFGIVEKRALSGSNLLWLAWDGADVLAAAVTSLDIANGRKFCTIVACSGHDIGLWNHLIARLENFARNEGCESVVIIGRRGWMRVLVGYEQTAVVMERKL